MRDRADNCVVICSIENFDPMGVHTGDSITVAPAQTLSDDRIPAHARRRLRVYPPNRRRDGRLEHPVRRRPCDRRPGRHRDESPRVSRSSALASKATGFPIAKIAAQLAVGYTLDEIPNDITGETPASFEPTIDYVVTKVPRWAFEKFPGIPDVLGTRMQSVGEAMAIGRTFVESLQKGLRSLERGRLGLNCDPAEKLYDSCERRRAGQAGGHRHARPPLPPRGGAPPGHPPERLYQATGVDPWFLDQIALIVAERAWLAARSGPADLSRSDWRRAKRLGFADAQLGWLWAVDEAGCAPSGWRRAWAPP